MSSPDESAAAPARNSSDTARSRVRIGTLWPADEARADLRSGTPMGVHRGLQAAGFETVPVLLGDVTRWPGSAFLPRSMRDRSRYALSAWRSGVLNGRLRDAGADVACTSMSPELCTRLTGDPPLVYVADALCGFGGPIIDGVHHAKRFSRFRRWVTRTAVRHASAVVVGTDGARRHAIEHFGADPTRVHVSSLGANVVYDGDDWDRRPSPMHDSVRLVQVASYPALKRVDDCVAAVETLRLRGIGATLTLIGPPTPAALASGAVECLGRLRLSSAEDAVTHRAAMLEAHAMLMPSRSEAFGIAACEAAHFGLPVIATRVGGLADIVRDGETGLLLPHDVSPAGIADAAERLIADADAWRAMSYTARALAVSEFTWTRWAERVAPVIESIAAEARSGAPRAA